MMQTVSSVNKINFRFLLGVLSKIIIVVFILNIILLIMPRIFKLTPYFVMSGSMENTIKYGSLILVKDTSFDAVEIKDIATFRSLKDANKTFTHRIIKIDTENRSFTTKGDANPTPDPVSVSEEQIVGKVVFIIPFAGYISVLLQNTLFTVIFIIVMIFWVAIEIELVLKNKKERNDKN